jgi:hypothetical protein
MTGQMSNEALGAAMANLRGTLKAGGLSVRSTQKWSHNQRCHTNNAMFAARVDGDQLLRGTELAVDFGLSPFAIQRGARVEQIGRANSYAVTIDLLRNNFGFGIDEVVALDLRHGFPRNSAGMAARARRTTQAIEANIHGRPDAPNIIDGAVLTRQIGGRPAYFEADGVGAKAGPVFHINEFKGWPVIDGRAEDAGKLGATQAQMGIYRYLLGDLIDALGGSLETVSPEGLLVTPKNVGLSLIGSQIDLAGATRVAETTLRNLPDPVDFAGALPAGLDFGRVADTNAPEAGRLEALDQIVDRLGSRYQDSCMASCGLAKFCRARAHARSDPAVAGMTAIRSLPGVHSLRRSADLATGAPANEGEQSTGVAAALASAGELYRLKTTFPVPPPVRGVASV